MKKIDMSQFRDAVKMMITQAINARRLQRIIQAELVSISPLTFSRGVDIVIKEDKIRLPYKKEFTKKEIGSTHAFIQEEGWQRYTYLYKVGE